MVDNTAKKGKKKVGKIVLAVFLVLVLIVNIASVVFEGHANLYLGTGEMVIQKSEGSENWESDYYKGDYSDADALATAAADLVTNIADEGFVLLKNNGVLPLSENSKLTMLGRGSVDSVYGGSGSGSSSSEGLIDLRLGLTNAGFEVNGTVYDILNSFASFTMEQGMFGPSKVYDNPKSTIVMDNPAASTYMIGEMPVDAYTSEAIDSFKAYGDAAIITISRPAGEGGDLSRDMKDWDAHYEAGQHQLELNYDEKQVIALAKENFENVIVLVNSSATMELGVLENDPEIDAILMIGFPGKTGFNSVGRILNGTVNPSGHTVDIYAADLTKDPTFVNVGHNQYSNINKDNAIGDATFVQYEEGIYIGYRYYETAAKEGFINYDEAVVYPFGYGLSYTTFDWKVVDQKLGKTDESISLDIEVTNTGAVAGKDVVQVYYSAPYTKGGIEKAEVVLGDFAKTNLLAPGESQVVTLTFAVEDMASYDYKTEKAYVLESGNYDIRVQTDSHNMKPGIDSISYEVAKTVVYDENNKRTSDLIEATNQFDDVSAMFTDTATEGYALNMSRADFAGTFPTAPTDADKVANDAIIEGFQAYVAADHLDENAVMPTTKASNGLSLIDLRGKDYNDQAWDVLLDQLDPAEIVKVIMNGAYTTLEMPSVAKPVTVDIDGPAGLSSFMGAEIKGTAYPAEVVIASTFNTDLAREMGVMVGNEALDKGVNGWYAPALNVHRSAFAGRNFEYYSEDPIVSAKITQAVVEGAATKGLYTFIKHFALNDQETNRVNNGIATWANEQAIREIYLKGFEKTVKNATTTINYIADDNGNMIEQEMKAATALMSSFNRVGATWSGGSKALQENVLRDEWGFEGVVISDFNLYDYMYANQGIAAGTDYYITFDSMKSIEDTTSATAVSNLRKSAHRLLYTVANSNAMNGIVPGSTIYYKTATWKIVRSVVDGVIIALLIIGFIVSRTRRKNDPVHLEK
ncbi:MAG: beta-glucosidase [Clostridiales bacterium 38-18]|nr:MAG: beta-glucosidase [Clostridiales bacterium 38-18]